MSYKNFYVLITALVMAAFISGCDNGSKKTVSKDTEHTGMEDKAIVIAHRGASGYLPEHTLAAYELAILMGADYIEPDLMLTKDGYLVAMHDDTLDATTNVAALFPDPRPNAGAKDKGVYAVCEFTLSEIKQLTVNGRGTSPNGASGYCASDNWNYPGYTPSMPDPWKVPTFDEVVDFAKAQSAIHGRKIGIYPEAKQADPVMEDKILATLAAKGMNAADSPVFIQSFSSETIKSMNNKQKAQGTKMPLIQLGIAAMQGNTAIMVDYVGNIPYAMNEVKEFADGVGVLIGVPAYPVTRQWIEQAHAAGLKVHGWTFSKANAVEAQTEYREYLDMGIDGMFSNFPNLAMLARDQFGTQY